MKTNTKASTDTLDHKTHEGAPARRINALQQLRRSVMACMLWEDEFYEDGKTIAERIQSLCEELKPEQVSEVAIEARKVMNMRHAPLLLLKALCKTGSGSRIVSDTIFEVISRADELAEFLSLYWKDGKKPLSAQMKKGLARAFQKFDAHQLAKYNRDSKIKLRDVLFMVHAKPKDHDQQEIWKKLAENALESPDTWEVALSTGQDKKATWERLLKEQNLGYMALMRNLRNMNDVGVDPDLIRTALEERRGAKSVLPFRFIAAAKAAPRFEPELDKSMIASLEQMPEFDGETIVLIDVSGSMNVGLSAKSDMNRIDAAAAIGCMVRGKKRVFTFSQEIVEVPPRTGLSGIQAVKDSQYHGGTYLGRAITEMNRIGYDRLIVITDEQSHDGIGNPNAKGYLINVASNKNGVGYGQWVHFDGFSERLLNFIHAYEKNTVNE